VAISASTRQAQILGQLARPEELPPLANAASYRLSQVEPVLASIDSVTAGASLPSRVSNQGCRLRVGRGPCFCRVRVLCHYCLNCRPKG